MDCLLIRKSNINPKLSAVDLSIEINKSSVNIHVHAKNSAKKTFGSWSNLLLAKKTISHRGNV